MGTERVSGALPTGALPTGALPTGALPTGALAVAVLGVSLGAALATPAPVAAWCQMVTGNLRPSADEPCVLASNHDGIHPLAWRRRCSQISISDALPPRALTIDEVHGVLETSFATWTSVECDGARTGLDVAVLTETNACSEAMHEPNGDNVNAILFVQEGWSTDRGHDPRAYAVTYVWHDPGSGEIYDADIEVNEQRGEYTICPEEGCTDGRIDLPNVLTHEIGHYFGLAHTPDDPFATMFASAPAGETIKRTLSNDDTSGLCAMYPPGALPEACDPTPRGGLDLTCTPGDTCGCTVPGARTRSAPTAAALVGLLALLVWRRRR